MDIGPLDVDDLKDVCHHEEFLELELGRLIHWRTPGLRETDRRVSRWTIATRMVFGKHLQAGCCSFACIAILAGGPLTTLLFAQGDAVPWWIAFPAGTAVSFFGLFVVNFVSHMFVDRKRRPQDVTIDYTSNEIRWKSRRGSHRKRLSDLTGFDVSLIGKASSCDGAALSFQCPDECAVILETAGHRIGGDNTLEQLIPFARALAEPLAIPVTHGEFRTTVSIPGVRLEKDELTVFNDLELWGRLRTMLVLSLFSVLLVSLLLSQAWHIATVITLAWLLPAIYVVVRNRPRVVLNRATKYGESAGLGKSAGFSLRHARSISVEAVQHRGKNRSYYTYDVRLQGKDTVELVQSKNRRRSQEIALRISEFLDIPMREEK